MPGPPPKANPAGHASRRKPANITTMKTLDGVAIPPPPEGLLASTAADWTTLWQSPLAKTYDPATDTIVMRRYFSLLDERERMSREVRKTGRMTVGSKGQEVLSPLVREIGSIDSELRQLEDRLGLSPLARMRLGVAMGEAARSLADINASLAADDEEEDEVDIRVVVLTAEGSGG